MKRKYENKNYATALTVQRVDNVWPDLRKKMANLLKLHLSLFIAEHDVAWYGESLWLVQVICTDFSIYNILSSDQSIHWGVVGKREQSEKQRCL